MDSPKVNRCAWVGQEEIYQRYHDTEWGVPLHDDRKHFEFIILDGAQAGLSWLTILKKREGYRQAFDHFDPQVVATYSRRKVESLLKDPGIVRNRLKVESTVTNAKAFLKVQEAFGSFDAYIWQFTEGETLVNRWKSLAEVPAKTAVSDQMSRDLKARGFKFVGSTICYAYMQAAGIVNDHTTDCFRWREVG